MLEWNIEFKIDNAPCLIILIISNLRQKCYGLHHHRNSTVVSTSNHFTNSYQDIIKESLTVCVVLFHHKPDDGN